MGYLKMQNDNINIVGVKREKSIGSNESFDAN